MRPKDEYLVPVVVVSLPLPTYLFSKGFLSGATGTCTSRSQFDPSIVILQISWKHHDHLPANASRFYESRIHIGAGIVFQNIYRIEVFASEYEGSTECSTVL